MRQPAAAVPRGRELSRHGGAALGACTDRCSRRASRPGRWLVPGRCAGQALTGSEACCGLCVLAGTCMDEPTQAHAAEPAAPPPSGMPFSISVLYCSGITAVMSAPQNKGNYLLARELHGRCTCVRCSGPRRLLLNPLCRQQRRHALCAWRVPVAMKPGATLLATMPRPAYSAHRRAGGQQQRLWAASSIAPHRAPCCWQALCCCGAARRIRRRQHKTWAQDRMIHQKAQPRSQADCSPRAMVLVMAITPATQ